jgi:GTP-binding protein
MTPAKRMTARIRKPREKNGGLKGKARNFTVAGDRGATTMPSASAFPLARAAYVLSVHDPRELPAPGAPEIAFAGRSNAGKSSAINVLAGQRRLAFVSKMPGRTQLINFFSIGDSAYLVDLPGYGYAGVPGAVREHWKELVGTYIAHRPSLAGVVVVMDSRRPLTDLDLTLLEWLRASGRTAHLLLTKSDKLSRQAAQATLVRVRARLAEILPGATVQVFSSLKRVGVEEAAAALARLVANARGERKKQSPG